MQDEKDSPKDKEERIRTYLSIIYFLCESKSKKIGENNFSTIEKYVKKIGDLLKK